jgi:hypothetical protein
MQQLLKDYDKYTAAPKPVRANHLGCQIVKPSNDDMFSAENPESSEDGKFAQLRLQGNLLEFDESDDEEDQRGK